jgi:hypothetical protein
MQQHHSSFALCDLKEIECFPQFSLKKLRCANILEAWGTPTKIFQGDLNSISTPKLLEKARGLEGWGIIATT